MKSLNLRRSLNKDKISSPSNFQSTSPVYSSAGAPALMSLPNGQTPAKPTQAGPYTPAEVLNAMAGKPTQNPKRVLRTTRNYQGRLPRELSFSSGDFFHVIAEVPGNGPDGQGWFDATNPLTGARGLIPMSYVQILGRNQKENEMLTLRGKSGLPTSSSPPPPSVGQTALPIGSPPSSFQTMSRSPPPGANNRSQFPQNIAATPTAPLTPGSKQQPLYGIVQYDFVAERADELDAKRGEPLIIIAQSNHEWFVAKPIGRLGGPGLIPVAFVEIHDSVTGKKVERQDVEELMRSGGVLPKVEEWKKKAAEYRSRSIPLGKFEFDGATTPVSVGSVNGATPLPTAPPMQLQSPIGPNPSNAPSLQMYQNGPSSSNSHATSSQHSPLDGSFSRNSHRTSSSPPPFPLLSSATVESFHLEDGSYWFHVRAKFDDGRSFLLYRLYEDFYDFQIALMDRFPYEAGKGEDVYEGQVVRSRRIIPKMPGPVKMVDEEVCSQRAHDLKVYLNELAALPEHLRRDIVFEEFLDLREGDMEMDRYPASRKEREKEKEGEGDGIMNFLEEMVNGKKEQEESVRSLESGMRNMGVASEDSYGYSSSAMSPQTSGSGLLASPPLDAGGGKTSSWNTASTSSTPLQQSSKLANAEYVKIKIQHRHTDDIIAIRVLSTVTFIELLSKTRERLGDVSTISFKETEANSARYFSINSDRDLTGWLSRGGKLVLYAD